MNRFKTVCFLGALIVGFLSETHCFAAENLKLIPHVGEWSRKDGVWETGKDSPPVGWYLRSLRQYDLQSLTFSVKKDKPAGLFYLYMTHWRILLRPNEVSVKYNGTMGPGKPPYREWPYYKYTATRPIDFPAGRWETFRLQLDGEYLSLFQGDKEILKWNSPHDEWYERIKASGKLKQIEQYQFDKRLPADALAGKDEIIVFQSLCSGASIKDVRVKGEDKGEAQGFVQKDDVAIKANVVPDWDIKRLAPREPVVVDWTLNEADKGKVSSLPAVNEWAFSDNQMEDPKTDSDKIVNILVGDPQSPKCPKFLYPFLRVKKTQAVDIFFNLEKAGDYTLKTSWGNFGMGWGPNVLQISVDGRPVSREVYRAFAQNGSCPAGFDYVPLHLNAGAHRIDLEMDLSHFIHHNFRLKFLRLPIKSIALTPGIQVPLYTATAGKTQTECTTEALASPISIGELYGKIIRYRLLGLQPGDSYNVTLGFQEIDVNRAGKRIMALSINNEPREDLDIFSLAGWDTEFFRTYPAKAIVFEKNQTGIELKLIGKNFKAFLNYIKVTDAKGATVFEQNCGWTKSMNDRLAKQEDKKIIPAMNANAIPACKGPWSKEDLFDGHNLVNNPHFSLIDQQRGKPLHWYSVQELASVISVPWTKKNMPAFSPELVECLEKAKEQPNFPRFYKILQGTGKFAFDANVGHDQPGSLKVEKTEKDFGITCNMPMVDAGKNQSFRIFVKTAGATGKVFPEIYWFAMNMDADMKYYDQGGLLEAPRLQLIGHCEGEAITGTKDWTQLTVRGKPPVGTIYAMMVVRVEDNTAGTVWIDDAELNGYGDEALEITLSYLGYHPRSDKHIVVKSLTKEPIQWKLVNVANGEVVKSGSGEYKEYEWFSKRHYYQIDLSAIDNEGEYRLAVSQNGRKVESAPFRITRNAYRELSRILLGAMRLKRMNCDSPGGHEPDCLEDAYTPNSVRPDRFCMYEKLIFPGRRDLSGGYYDAGDMIKHVEFWPTVLLALQNMNHRVQPAFTERSANDILDEIAWACEAFSKFQLSDSTYILSTKPQGYATDNIPFYAIDRTVDQAGILMQSAGICAMTAFELKGHNPELSRKYLAMAMLSYKNDNYWKYLEKINPDATITPQDLTLAAKSILAEAYLYKLTGEPIYFERLEKHARIVAGGLKQKSYKDLAEMFGANFGRANALQDCVWGPTLVLRLYPDLKEGAELKAGLRAFAGHVAELSAKTVWGQASAMNVPAGSAPARFPCETKERSVGYWSMLAYTLSEVGILLEDPAIIRLAEVQLQWCLGKNFADMSMVQGVGERFVVGGDHIYWQSEFFNAWLKSDKKQMYFPGNVPTMALRDIGTGEVKVKKGDNWDAPVEGYPLGFCKLAIGPDYGFHPNPSEYYLPQTAQFALAAASVHAALEWLEKQGK